MIQSATVQLGKMLGNLESWLAPFDAEADAILDARLAPGTATLGEELDNCATVAEQAAHWLAGVELSEAESPASIIDHRRRLAGLKASIEGLDPERFEGADCCAVTLSFLPGQALSGCDYLIELVLPNFYFHATMAYTILGSIGLGLDKRDYIGMLSAYRASEARDDEPSAEQAESKADAPSSDQPEDEGNEDERAEDAEDERAEDAEASAPA